MEMVLIMALCSLTYAGLARHEDVSPQEWENFKWKYDKNYSDPVEESFRMKVFAANRQIIALHNQQAANGLKSYTLGMNEFGDLLHSEFVKRMTGFKTDPNSSEKGADFLSPSTFLEPLNSVLPDSVDWREHGLVTPVKNQGACGSCWTFSTTGALEGQNFRKTGELTPLSEQNLIDCAGVFGTRGCHGGYVNDGYRYIYRNDGIDKEQSYPYEGRDGKCRYSPSRIGAQVTGYVNIPKGSEENLKIAIATVGPISVAIDCSHPSFRFYKSGIFYEPSCSSNRLNHAVLAVGYGSDSSGDEYYIVKNSWGESWGDNGYIHMARNKDNNCGIATAASYPMV